MLITEPNFQRKSHRVDIPLFVEINSQLFRAIDWSIGGLAIQQDKNENVVGQIVAGRVVLPLGDARLSLDVELVIRRLATSEIGYEFHELSEKNRRILRHYIQLHVDGKLENAEDLVAISTGPEFSTPLNEALTLSEENTDALVKGFKHRGMIALGLILLFVIVFASVLFYNTQYRLETTGVVIGNADRVTANYDGILLGVDTKLETYVRAGTPLFRLKNMAVSGTAASSSRSSIEIQRALLKSLETEATFRHQGYRNALMLYQQRLITRKDLENVQNSYTTSRTAYLRQKTLLDGVDTQSKAIGHQQGGPLYPIIRAPHDGQVVAISGTTGSHVSANDVIVILQRNDKVPQIAISVENKHALKLHIGMKAKIYVPFQEKSYLAEISSIGRAAINTALTESMEASLNGTLITLAFDDPSVRLPFNARVRVWIKTL